MIAESIETILSRKEELKYVTLEALSAINHITAIFSIRKILLKYMATDG